MNTQSSLFNLNSIETFDDSAGQAPETKTEPSDLERKAYCTIIEPDIVNVCDELNISPDDFTLNSGTGYSSIRYDTFLIMRLKLRGKRHYISFPKSYAVDLPNNVEVEYPKSEPGYVRIYTSLNSIYSLSTVIRCIIQSAMQHIPKEYDCCALYMECSDAKRCVKADKKSALGCGYKKILESGTIFYGKNRTIDVTDSN